MDDLARGARVVTAALLWAAVEAARDREAEAALGCSIAAFDRAAWWAAAEAHERALVDLRAAEAAYWSHPGAGRPRVIMLAA